MRYIVLSQSEINKLLEEHLQENEQILAKDSYLMIVEGIFEKKFFDTAFDKVGYLVATNQRVIFYIKNIAGFQIRSFPYNMISSIETGKNFMGSRLNIIAAGNMAPIKNIKDEIGFQTLLDAVQEEMKKSKSSSHEEKPSNSITDELTKLSQLLESKLITEEEFQTLKNKIINQN